MRIVEWNCQGAFRNKNKEIMELKPDILIVLECEEEKKIQFGNLTPRPNAFIWYGDEGKKGVGIFSYSNYTFRLLKDFNPKYRYVIPLEVTNGVTSFLLFAVWAMDNKKNPLAGYIGQVWRAVNYYQTILKENVILIGDFNSNQCWDEKERVGNHTDVVTFLNKLNIESVYHKQNNEAHGQESQKTFFMYRNIQKPYHIDYIFASHNITQNGYKLTLESPLKWIDKSDHIPLIFDVPSFESTVCLIDTYEECIKRHIECLTEVTKLKYRDELQAIEHFAKCLDSEIGNQDRTTKLINSIEILEQIDKLTIVLKQNKL